ncbi:DDT domain-containing protein [Euphorbia peplus]|nr:DDT domain-containing protein [Euphorbia peplus]
MLSLKDLADSIATKLQEDLFVGAELQGRKDSTLCPCKVVKVLKEGSAKTKYEVAWLDENNKIMETSVVKRDDLEWKKFPLSRRMLRPLIRNLTYRSSPWVLHNNVAQKNGISCDPPQELKGKLFIQNGLVVCNKKRKDAENGKHNEEGRKHKKKRVQGEEVEATNMETVDEMENNHINYPIDDLLVQPGADDPVFTDRPSPSRDLNIPMEYVGDLLMIWDFCCSFGRMLYLSPFTLEDFENAICHKESNLSLIVEMHSALLRLLMKDNGEYAVALKKRNRKMKITLVTWGEYLCDFLELIKVPSLSIHTTTIKRGHYGLLDVGGKLLILGALVSQVLETDLLREKLGEHIEQRQALFATRRGEALEEGRRRREEKDRSKAETVDDKGVNGPATESRKSNLNVSENGKNHFENGETAEDINEKVISDTSESHGSDTTSRKTKQSAVEILDGNVKKSSGKIEQLKQNGKEVDKRSKEQQREDFEKEIEKRVLRTNSLGKDRNYNRYWWFRRDGRIFIESSDFEQWGYYSSKEELDAFMGSLNCKGEREKALREQLEKLYSRICVGLQKRSKQADQKIGVDEEAVLRRSTRVRALPRENPANAYVNKWKEDRVSCV